ncbi:conjugal transfer protein TraF [Hydrogenovibrio kuenenii]|uniref:conjugal transfer protein TraF n=1 Tax=Hydrogenovibrio kuenenii TaxID=63658 RepID=UPI000466F1CF|nr:conjugal transfer protein TraF [Hydrogenovibrio kuenenii]
MKRQLLLSCILAACATGANAAPSSYMPIGPNITYGDASNSNTIYSPLANPSYNAINKSDTEGYRLGLGVNGQINYESKGLEGYSDYFKDKIQAVIDTNNPALAGTLQTNLNNYFTKYNGGHVAVQGGVTIPLLIKSGKLDGGISLDISKQYATQVNVVRKSNVTVTTSGTNFVVTPGSAGWNLSYRELTEMALGYGKNVFSKNGGTLSVGLTARYLTMLSNTKMLDFSTVVSDNNGSSSKDTGDYLSDLNTGSSSSAITADIGINWIHDNYSLGFVGMNLTSPTFKTHDLSTTATSTSFAGYYSSSDFQLKPQYRITGQLNTESRHWTLAGSYDLAKANDLNNQDTQWWSASASYATNSAWYVPDLRLGLRGNMAGNKNTYTDVGLTFGFLNLDVATTTTDFSGVIDKQKDSGLIASAGIEFDF